jgi:hypothetical protein
MLSPLAVLCPLKNHISTCCFGQIACSWPLGAGAAINLSIRAAIGGEMHFLSAIGIRPKATPELIRKGVVISSECAADGLSLGHYDGAPLKNLEAVRQGLAKADATL